MLKATTIRNATRSVSSQSRSLLCNRTLSTAAPAKPVSSGTEASTSSQEKREDDYAWGTEDEDRLGQLLSAPTFRLTYQDSLEAKQRLEGKIARTGCDLSARLSNKLQTQLYLKKEHSTITGSYKGRGILNKLLRLSAQEKKQGVVCASGGNHAVALSYHAAKLGINSVSVIPKNTYFTQVTSSQAFGGNVVLHGLTFAEAHEKALEIAQSQGRVFIPCHNDRDVCAGQSTVAHDLILQNPYLDLIVCPVAGGTLLGSLAMVVKTVNPRIKVYGVESSELRELHKSLARPPPPIPAAIANATGYTPDEMLRKFVDGVLFVSEMQRASSILTMMEIEKSVVQGAGVTAVAAVLHHPQLREEIKGKQVAALLTGGNIESSLLVRVIDKGLVSDNRIARIRVTIKESQFAKCTGVLSRLRANIIDVSQERAFLTNESIGYTQPIFTIETRGPQHIEEIIQAFKDEGFPKTFLDSNFSGRGAENNGSSRTQS